MTFKPTWHLLCAWLAVHMLWGLWYFYTWRMFVCVSYILSCHKHISPWWPLRGNILLTQDEQLIPRTNQLHKAERTIVWYRRRRGLWPTVDLYYHYYIPSSIINNNINDEMLGWRIIAAPQRKVTWLWFWIDREPTTVGDWEQPWYTHDGMTEWWNDTMYRYK